MIEKRTRRAPAALVVALLLALGSAASAIAVEYDFDEAAAILADAFKRRFDVDLTSEIELVMQDRNGREHRRVFDAASKMIEGRLHSVGKLNWPVYLRDMTILMIEADGRDHDAFVYLPTLGRVRRVSSAQRGDSFFGTDVTYEDLERRHVDDFEIIGIEQTQTHGEAAFRISAQPREPMTYSSVDYFVASADRALLEVQYYKDRARGPFRVITSVREHLLIQNGHIVPTRMTVKNLSRKTTTTATFHRLVLDPEIDDRLFSVTVLERNPKLRNHTHAPRED